MLQSRGQGWLSTYIPRPILGSRSAKEMGGSPSLNPENLRNVVEWIVDCYRDSDDDMGFEFWI